MGRDARWNCEEERDRADRLTTPFGCLSSVGRVWFSWRGVRTALHFLPFLDRLFWPNSQGCFDDGASPSCVEPFVVMVHFPRLCAHPFQEAVDVSGPVCPGLDRVGLRNPVVPRVFCCPHVSIWLRLHGAMPSLNCIHCRRDLVCSLLCCWSEDWIEVSFRLGLGLWLRTWH